MSTKDIMLHGGYAGMAPMIDLSAGGQFSYSTNFKEIDSSQAYVRQNITAILLEAPLFIRYMPNPQEWIRTLKALVEERPLRIEGLNGTLETEWGEHAIGGGEVIEENLRVTRQRSTPTYVYQDPYGAPIEQFLEAWQTIAIRSPDTGAPLINTFPNAPTELLHRLNSMTVLHFEADPAGKKVRRAWVNYLMKPKSNGNVIGGKDQNAALTMDETSVEWTSTAKYGNGPVQLAQNILNSINFLNANPSNIPAGISGMSPDVLSVDQDVGYRSSVEDIARTQI